MTIDPLRQLCLERGFFLRREAMSHDVDDGALRRGLRSGHLVRVRHGAYTFDDLWTAASASERHMVLAGAVSMVHPDRVALTHHSAVAMHGFESWRLPLDKVHVTRMDDGAGRSAGDVVHHVGRLAQTDVVAIRDVLTVQAVRAALESATLLDAERALVLLDSGLRQKLFTPEDLARQAAVMSGWPHSAKLQVVARLADGRSGSVGESRCRHLFWRLGLPAPLLQYDVHDERGLVGTCDFAWPGAGLLGEFDGKVKYQRYLRPGESASDAVFREKQREDRLRRATGWRVVRLTWDMLDAPQQAAMYVRALLRGVA